MINAVVFDFDGVIVDTEPLHYRAFIRVLAEYDVQFDYPQYCSRYIGYDDHDGFAAMLTDAGHAEPGSNPTTLKKLCQLKAQAFELIASEGVDPIEGALELIEHLACELPLAIASGASRQDIDLVLGGLGRADRFKTIVSADDVRRSKPDPQTYRLAVDQLATASNDKTITPASCLAIEDTQAGAMSARDAGLSVLGLSPDALRLPQAHRVTPTLRGLTANQLHEWFD